MFHLNKGLLAASALLAATLLLCACGEKETIQNSQSTSNEVTEKQTAVQQKDSQEVEIEEVDVHTYTDWTGHEVDVPLQPERVIFHGETTGDLLVLGVQPVGILYQSIADTAAEERLHEVEDIGFPFNVEKAMSLDPDLIIFGNADEAQYEAISKVAPTVTFNTFDLLDERMEMLGKLLNKREEAAKWLDQYHSAEREMWRVLREGGIKETDTATVLTMYPGNRLFVMARTGLSQLLYSEQGLLASQPIAKLLEEQQGFLEISMEVLPEYAGDHLFMLTPVADDAAAELNQLQDSEIWASLPAVQAGRVYSFGIREAYSDAVSREQLLELLPKVMLEQDK